MWRGPLAYGQATAVSTWRDMGGSLVSGAGRRFRSARDDQAWQPSAVIPLLRLADERFVSLTTFRRSGQPVSTPVWVGRDGDALIVLTPAGSGKVKRLRHEARVEVRPCGRFGAVADGVVPVEGTAELQE